MPGDTTLHAEIAAILAESTDEWMTTNAIAEQVNARGRYRKANGSRVSAFQVHGRTKNYPRLFERDGSRVRLRRGATSPDVPAPPTRSGPSVPIESELIEQAVAALSAPGLSVADSAFAVPHRPGLYAITATHAGLHELRIGAAASLLYVGKAERSLEGRDLRTHFADGKTGWSTLRRSLAALLTHDLDLAPMPRNPRTPADFDRFALEPDSDRRLSEWMVSRLRIACWPVPLGSRLRPIEIAAIHRLRPALNLTDMVTMYSQRVRTERKAMANRARQWTSV